MMATIDSLVEATIVGDNDLLLIDQGGEGKKLKASNIYGGKDGLRSLKGFTDELFAQADIVDDGQPDKLGASQRVDAINAIGVKRYVIYFKNDYGHSAVENMIAGRINGVAGTVSHSSGNVYNTGGTEWQCLLDGASVINDFQPLTPVNVRDFGAMGDGINDDAPAINLALSVAASKSMRSFIPKTGLPYIVKPFIPLQDEAGQNICAFEIVSNLHVESDGAEIKIQNGVSSDANPRLHAMFLTNKVVENIRLKGLTLNMNGQNNLISPNRPTSMGRWTNAQIIVSGTIGGVAAKGSDVKIEDCKFINNAGVSCIVAQQSNTTNVELSRDWIIDGCEFRNVGLDTDDHSSIFGWAIDFRVTNCLFINPEAYKVAEKTGGLVACELHGSNNLFQSNTIKNYDQGLWVSINLTEPEVRNITISDNLASVGSTFVDFYSKNLDVAFSNESSISMVSITGNTVELPQVETLVQVKAGITFGAVDQPTLVDFSHNIVRAYDTTKECVLAKVIVSPGQVRRVFCSKVTNNIAAGISVGMIVFFGGEGSTAVGQNVESIAFENNDLGYLVDSPTGLYPKCSVYLYGPRDGTVEILRVSGTSSLYPSLLVESYAGYRATVYGSLKLPIATYFEGVTIGGATQTSYITLDTDSRTAHVHGTLVYGIGTTPVSPLLLRFPGVFSDGTVPADVILISGADGTKQLTGKIDNTGSWVTVYDSSGIGYMTPLAAGESISVSATFPCIKAFV